MNISDIKNVAAKGQLADPNSKDLIQKTLASLWAAHKDEKPDNIFERRFSKGAKKGVTLESLSACAEALKARKEAKNNRVKVEFDNFAQMEEAKKKQDIGKWWQESGKIVAYSYGAK